MEKLRELVPSWFGDIMARNIRAFPKGWKVDIEEARLVICTAHISNGLRIVITAKVEKDGCRWIHLSASRRHRLPTYEELSGVKKFFFGEGSLVIQVFAPKEEHVNIHPNNTLHLWYCLDRRPTPDFRVGSFGV